MPIPRSRRSTTACAWSFSGCRHVATAAVSVFVRSGSQHESARNNGISHFIEHMAFKGTRSRDCQQINLDAERLGAEVNAHTDKNHTAFHMRGLARDAGAFLRMLGDIVRESTFPEAELERERQVILHEYTEDEDDALSTAFKLFDKACYGEHAVARPVIGSRANIRRFTRAELVAYVRAAVHRRQRRRRHRRQCRRRPDRRRSVGGVRRHAARQRQPGRGAGLRRRNSLAPDARLQPGARVLGFPIPGLLGEYQGAVVAAALFGEGMSSPLLDRIRERRGLVYHADCSADVTDLCGQFVIEASTSPEHLDEYFVEVTRLLREHAEATDPVGLERARNQIMVRSLCAQEVPSQRLEIAALDLFAFGRVRSREELMAGIAAVTPVAGARGVRANARRGRRSGAGRQDRQGRGGTGRSAGGPGRRLSRLVHAISAQRDPTATMMRDNVDFYAQLPVFADFAAVMDPARYRSLPDDWLLGLTDVEHSTQAIEGGRYKAVNTAGASVISAVTNALSGRAFPFVFGGDGASLALAPGDEGPLRAALAATAAWSRDELELALRAAVVPVSAVRAQGLDVAVARFAPSANVSYAMFFGGGLAWAERAMKAGQFAVAPSAPGVRPDLVGPVVPVERHPVGARRDPVARAGAGAPGRPRVPPAGRVAAGGSRKQRGRGAARARRRARCRLAAAGTRSRSARLPEVRGERSSWRGFASRR